MATRPIEGSVSAFPATPPLVAVARILGRFDRPTLEAFMTVAVELLDIADGDPDFENATDLEDDHALSPQACSTGPGCEVADTGEDDDIETGIEDDPRGCDPETDFGGEELGECEQIVNDVPTVPCFAIEPGDDGKRASSGFGTPAALLGIRARHNSRST